MQLVLAEGAVNSGDTAFVIICTALVLMMALPGLMLWQGGLSGFRSVLSTALQTIAIASLISIVWLMFGYSLCFGADREMGKLVVGQTAAGNDVDAVDNNRFIGGANKFWLRGDGKDTSRLLPGDQVGTLPESVFLTFQLTYAIFAAAIAAGKLAERMKFSSMLVFFFFWHLLVYCPVCHWWWGNGFIQQWGSIDFAGGSVVHITAGITGLVGSLILNTCYPRKEAEETRSEHTVLMTFIGGCLLWVGWLAWNAGSALAAAGSAGMALLITHLAASTSAFTWMLLEWLHTGNPTVIGTVSGAVTGLIVITPAAGFVDHTGAFVMGLIGALLSYPIIFIKNKVGLDEKPNQSAYPDAFGVHAIGGILGGLMVGFFANPAINLRAGAWYPLEGDKYTNGRQLGWQFAGIGITVGYVAVTTAILMLILKITIGICNPEPEEEEPEAVPEQKTLVIQPVAMQPVMMARYPSVAMPAMMPMGMGMPMMGSRV
jgi:Amt family ammonium transporter